MIVKYISQNSLRTDDAKVIWLTMSELKMFSSKYNTIFTVPYWDLSAFIAIHLSEGDCYLLLDSTVWQIEAC